MSRTAHCLVLLIAGLLLLSGCLSIQRHSTADPHVLHHHNWWNYYERGRLYLRENNPAAAKKDFETALGRIPGARYPYAEERWRVRTYGMHMLEGYFPHRELGICLFELGEHGEALELLEYSIQLEPSGRAKFYINQIRKQSALSTALPRIGTDPLPGWTSQRTIILRGDAVGPNPIENLTINGEPEFIELASGQLPFKHELTLQEGLNDIIITATDLAGRETSTNLTITADWTPPQIHLKRNGSILEITCRDDSGFAQLQVNAQTIAPAGTDYRFDWPIPGKALDLKIVDRAGNSFFWSLSEKELQHLAQSQKAEPPKLTLADAGKTITLYNNEYVLDVRAEDDTALRMVSVNGNLLLSEPTPLFRSLRRIPLVPGTNQLVIAAEDLEDNRTEKQITVIYRQPEYLDRIYRLATTLSPLSGEIPDPAYGRRVNHLMGHTLTLDPVRFYLLADEKESDRLKKEQELSGSYWADPRALLKTGKQLDADLVFITRVLRDAPGQTVYTQVLDTQSGKELFIEDVYLEDESLLPQKLEGLVMKIEQRFPVMQARVEKRDGRLAINAGEKSGAHAGMRLLVVRSEDSFEQGRVIRAGNQPAELIVSEVESDSALFIIPKKQIKDPVQSGDFVFTR
jgi:hypothetical protein